MACSQILAPFQDKGKKNICENNASRVYYCAFLVSPKRFLSKQPGTTTSMRLVNLSVAGDDEVQRMLANFCFDAE